MEQSTAQGRTAPYISWGRYEGFLDSLKGKPVPPRIDRSVTARMSGADRSQVKIANIFLSLVRGEDAEVTEAFRRLVQARGTPDWPQTLASVIEPAYANIVGGLDEHATRGQLIERFRERGNVSGASLLKAIRFYLSAAAAAGLRVSPHFEGPNPPAKPSNGSTATPARPRATRTSRKSRSQSSGESEGPAASAPAGMRELRFPLPGKQVQLWIPDDISDPELEFVWKYLRDYLNLKRGAPLSEPSTAR